MEICNALNLVVIKVRFTLVPNSEFRSSVHAVQVLYGQKAHSLIIINVLIANVNLQMSLLLQCVAASFSCGKV